ncbi:hypothetical protein RHMOL_Rhmol10G0038400 [Rhododendron molle]|uniref:Uncharacterized protein n=1 Tax=Rhododendron molle TaxID=49168 RepID=A0ACC0LZ03_RHOML|nr:hypothetical protein RHMOL_Rhmol10G0038400 [Rhododendron molle]
MDSRVLLAFCLCFLSLLPEDLARSATDKRPQGSVLRLTTGVSFAPFDPTRVTQISWRPRAFIYKGFLTDEECDHLIHLAKDKLEKSMVADNNSGKSIESEVRTSSGMFLIKAQDDIVAGVEARIAAWTFLPEDNGESLQILHYEHGQKYEPHFDYFYDKINQELGGHRVATVLMYLSDVNRGGETVFPDSEVSMLFLASVLTLICRSQLLAVNSLQAKVTQPKDDDWSDCAKKGYAVKPHKGDALLFFSLHPNTTTDPLSLHGSCPVIEGEKWSATKWIHVRSFEKMVRKANGDCRDENENCEKWAAAGECERNPKYMVGSEGVGGFCRKSCKVCSSSS